MKKEVKLKREKTPERLSVLPERLIDYVRYNDCVNFYQQAIAT